MIRETYCCLLKILKEITREHLAGATNILRIEQIRLPKPFNATSGEKPEKAWLSSEYFSFYVDKLMLSEL